MDIEDDSIILNIIRALIDVIVLRHGLYIKKYCKPRHGIK